MSKRQQTAASACVLCGADIAEHFNGDSWTGCVNPRGPMFIPPMMIVLSPEMLRFVAGAVEQVTLPTAPPLPEPEPDEDEDPEPEQAPEPAPVRRATRARRAAPGDRRQKVDETQPERRRATDAKPRRQRKAVSADSALSNGTTDDTRGRGRIAGRYMLSDKLPTKVTESIEAVYKVVKSHKRGLTVKDIANRLSMPTGTVGWAVQKLVHQGAVQYQPQAS